MSVHDVQIDVTAVAGLGTAAHTAVTVHLPDDPAAARVVCFAFPGAGYSRRYWTFDVDGAGSGGQADHHRDNGWIMVTCDHLGVGDSTVPSPDTMRIEDVAAGNAATVAAVVEGLRTGSLIDGLGPVTVRTVLGLGQSMGGCLTIVTQAHHRCFDGIGVLGFSAIHTSPPTAPGSPPLPLPWIPRTSSLDDPVVLNPSSLGSGVSLDAAEGEPHPLTWAFHHEAEPADVVAADMAGMLGGPVPEWRSATIPALALHLVTPGAVAGEAAAIDVPVLTAFGERDVAVDPRREVAAFLSAPDVTFMVLPRMAHMHNFAPSRHRLWRSIQRWGDGIDAEVELSGD